MIERDASFDGYRVERMLGHGGMGVVYEAVQSSLERRVALKLLRPELARDPAFVDRLRREGKLQASLEHAHVLDVYEIGESPHGVYLAMRLVRGPTLAELLREGELNAQRTLSLLGQVGDALDAAHAAGLVHRDVKPQNVLVEAGDFAFLADFGLTRAGTDSDTAASRATLGTVAYVAPEVIRGEEPGHASDRYAFAATLFHCLTGDVVFSRGSDAAILFAHASEPPPRISDRRAELPRALDQHFERALAKDPEDRPASAAALVESVRKELGDDVVGRLGPPDLLGGRRPMPVTIPSAPSHVQVEPERRRPLVLMGVVAAVAALLGGGAVALLDEPDEAPVEAPVPALPDGAEPLGSGLALPENSLDCRGREPGQGDLSCAILQTDLPGAQLLVPADGLVVGWAVRGASGELALDAIRPGGDDTTRIGRSQWESAGNDAPHYFRTSIPVERGDLLGVELGPGATIGVRETAGATTQRWLSPEGGFYGSPDREAGTGFDYELALRADFVPDGVIQAPNQLRGADAARAPDGRVRERVEVEITRPPANVTVELVELRDRVALDLLRDGRREARMFVPDLLPGGQPVQLESYTFEGEPFSEVDLWWVNPSTGRMIFHFFTASRHQFKFLG